MLDRRASLLASAAGGASIAWPGLAVAPAAGRSPELAALFDAFFQEGLQLRPESATQLGLDKGPNLALRSRMTTIRSGGSAI